MKLHAITVTGLSLVLTGATAGLAATAFADQSEPCFPTAAEAAAHAETVDGFGLGTPDAIEGWYESLARKQAAAQPAVHPGPASTDAAERRLRQCRR